MCVWYPAKRLNRKKTTEDNVKQLQETLANWMKYCTFKLWRLGNGEECYLGWDWECQFLVVWPICLTHSGCTGGNYELWVHKGNMWFYSKRLRLTLQSSCRAPPGESTTLRSVPVPEYSLSAGVSFIGGIGFFPVLNVFRWRTPTLGVVPCGWRWPLTAASPGGPNDGPLRTRRFRPCFGAEPPFIFPPFWLTTCFFLGGSDTRRLEAVDVEGRLGFWFSATLWGEQEDEMASLLWIFSCKWRCFWRRDSSVLWSDARDVSSFLNTRRQTPSDTILPQQSIIKNWCSHYTKMWTKTKRKRENIYNNMLYDWIGDVK